MRAFTRAGVATVAVLLAAASSPPLGAQDAPTQPCTSADGKVVLAFPSSWTTTPQAPEKPRQIIRAAARPPDSDQEVGVAVFRVEGYRSERGRIHREFLDHQRIYATTSGQVLLEPVPHFWMDDARAAAKPQRELFVPRILNRTGYAVILTAPPALFDRVRPALLAAARSLASSEPESPPIPAGYRSIVRGDYQFLLHPDAREKDVAPLHAAAVEIEAGFARTHGPVRQSPDNRVQILLHASVAASDAALQGKSWNRHGCFDDPQAARVWAAPLPKDPAGRAVFAACLTRVLHYQTHDDFQPLWLYWAVSKAAEAETLAGKPLPAIPESLAGTIPPLVPRFDGLTNRSYDEIRSSTGDLLVYIAFFRAGPKPYQDAWAAFTRELDATGNWRTAQAHLLALDQDALRRDASAFGAKSFKPVKGR